MTFISFYEAQWVCVISYVENCSRKPDMSQRAIYSFLQLLKITRDIVSISNLFKTNENLHKHFLHFHNSSSYQPLCKLQGNLSQGLHTLAELSRIGSTRITQEMPCIDPLIDKNDEESKVINTRFKSTQACLLLWPALCTKITNLGNSCHFKDRQGQVEIQLWQSRWDPTALAVNRDQVAHRWDTCSVVAQGDRKWTTIHGIDAKDVYMLEPFSILYLLSLPSIPFKLPIVSMMLKLTGQ